MKAWIRLGEVWGIPIGLHPSWLVVWALVTWSLAAGYFPVEHPEWPRGLAWVLGAVTSAVFFACIVAHELGHSWVALRHGVPIRSITLFVFGGVARTGREPDAPAAELSIAIAGPITSLVLAALLGALSLAAREAAVLAAPLAWLARINLMVALFNLLPGFPLDGGRVLRAAVWRWTGSFRRATRAAATAGQVGALGLVGVGVLGALAGRVIEGMWMVLIGWFLQDAARATEAEAGLRDLLGGAAVASVMRRDAHRVGAEATLAAIVQGGVLGAGQRCFFVAEDGRLRGLLTLHEVKVTPRERWGEVTAGEVMKPADRLVTAAPGDSLLQAIERMDDAGVHQLPVLDGARLVGSIDREQILHYVRTRAELGS